MRAPTGGHLKPDPYNRPSGLAVTHGADIAAECAAFESRNLLAVKKAIEDEGIDCDFVLTRAIDALMSDAICDTMKAKVELLRGTDSPVIGDVHFNGGAEAEKVCRGPH